MVQKLKYTLIFTFIIIISSITFAISEGTSVPIYLTVPEYLKITDLSQSSLLLYADISNWFETVEASLTFKVKSNVNYNLTSNFEVADISALDFIDDSPLENSILEDSIKNNYSLVISDEDGTQFVDDGDQGISVSSETPGIHNYSLTFQLDVEGLGLILYPITEGKIGTIKITVSSN